MTDLVLAGKDFFTQQEAATYCCVSDSQFRAKAAEYGVEPFPWMGKQVYARADLYRLMEAERRKWQQSIPEAAPGTSSGRKAGSSGGSHWAASLVPKPSGRGR